MIKKCLIMIPLLLASGCDGVAVDQDLLEGIVIQCNRNKGLVIANIPMKSSGIVTVRCLDEAVFFSGKDALRNLTSKNNKRGGS